MTASQSVKRCQLFQRLTKSDAEAQAFVQEVEAVVDSKFEQKKEVLATRDDIRLVQVQIAESKADTIKWMFIFWAGSILAIVGAFYGFFKAFSLPR